jgi:hypothetical protein
MKSKSDDDNESIVAGISPGSITHSTVSVRSTTIMRQNNDDYLSFGLISSGEEQSLPKCMVCSEKQANQAVVPSKLKGHLHTKHPHLCEKPIETFERLVADQVRQAKQWTKITTTSYF